MSFTTASNKVEFKTSDETNSSLNELFDVNSLSRQKPFNERQLPKSFFVQPCGSGLSLMCVHHKGFSSPATLEETYRAGPGNDRNYHSKQRSLDSKSGNQIQSEFNHAITTETKSSPSINNSTVYLKFEIETLPLGYEMAVDSLNRVYFMNHATKETTWFDPRFPKDIQRWGMTLKDLEDLHMSHMHTVSDRRSSISSLRSQQRQCSQFDQNHRVFDPKSQKLCSRLLSSPGLNLGPDTLSDFQMSSATPMTHLQYFVNTANGSGSIGTSSQELCHLYPYSSSIQGSLSHSSNSSCSNLSCCLNGLNLSPPGPFTPTATHAMTMSLCQYGCHISPGTSTADRCCHSHQNSLDSGVGPSLIGQCHHSVKVAKQCHVDEANLFDMSPKLVDNDNLDNCFDNNIDEFMDIDISIDFQ